VGIGGSAHAQVLGPFIAAGPLRKSDEESLLWRQPIARREGLRFGCVLPGNVSQNLAAEVGDILASVSLLLI